MAIYDCYNIRYNTANAQLEMNTGAETWIPVPDSVTPGELAVPNTQIIVGNVSGVGAAVAMSSGATISNTGAVTLGNAAVTGQAITGYVSGAGAVSATDTILQAFNKLNGNDGLKLNLTGGTLTGGLIITSTVAGFLPPRMTEAERDLIAAPAEGLIVYNLTSHKLNLRVAAAWEVITSA